MFLSKLVLNYRDRTAQQDLSNVHKLHQRIMQGFPDESREHPRNDWHILFRQEPDSEVILIQSAIEPDWSHLSSSYVVQLSDPKPVVLDIANFPVRRSLFFRLRANPSKRDKQTTKTVGLFRREDQMDWLDRQADRNGFQIQNVDIIPSPDLVGRKSHNSSPIRIKTVMFQGILEISNPESFVQSLQQGIGRGKSYGCGLLSVARRMAM